MKYVFWGPGGRCPAKDDANKALKGDTRSIRGFRRSLKTFWNRTSDQMYASRAIKPVKGSSNKLQEWSIDLNKKTARMFFVIHQGCAHFLHFFIKKSSSGISTPKTEIKTAEDRAEQFWKQRDREK